MLESRILRNLNELNIPYGSDYGYEAMYFGVNLILMLEYQLSLEVNVTEGDDVEVLIVRRRDYERWKNGDLIQSLYKRRDRRINYIFIPITSDSQ
ncbi:MAG: hypothetical protein QXU32_07255 [Nitrososphaerales archaeon]